MFACLIKIMRMRILSMKNCQLAKVFVQGLKAVPYKRPVKSEYDFELVSKYYVKANRSSILCARFPNQLSSDIFVAKTVMPPIMYKKK